MVFGLSNKALVSVVAVLAGIKFVLLPVAQWQNEQLAVIEQHEKRNAKAERLLDSEEQLALRLATLDKDYKALADKYPRFEAPADFRIETQIMFDMLLQQENLKVTQFFWREKLDKEVINGMYMGRFNVDFTGKLKDVALLQGRLATTEKAYRVANLSIAVKNQTDKSLGEAQGTFTVEAYYWLGAQ